MPQGFNNGFVHGFRQIIFIRQRCKDKLLDTPLMFMYNIERYGKNRQTGNVI